MAAETPYEYTTVERFAEFVLDDERESFTFAELHELAYQLRASWKVLLQELTSYGLALEGQAHEKKFRTVTDNPHDRWTAYPSHGGSGWEQIAGFAGQRG